MIGSPVSIHWRRKRDAGRPARTLGVPGMDDPAALVLVLADELRAHLERGKLAGVMLAPAGGRGCEALHSASPGDKRILRVLVAGSVHTGWARLHR